MSENRSFIFAVYVSHVNAKSVPKIKSDVYAGHLLFKGHIVFAGHIVLEGHIVIYFSSSA